jgi:zinc/manganese transport system substrate-binding protein
MNHRKECHMRKYLLPVLAFSLLFVVSFLPSVHGQGASKPIQVCATVPDLASLAKEVGGNQVSVTVFAKGKEDPHFVEAKPSFIKALSQADLYIQIGMDLEIGWAPVLLQNARNGRVLPGEQGFVDASRGIVPLEVPTGPVDRSMGDVHPAGNPHYLLDPLNGLRVARLIKDKLAEHRPGQKQFFEEQLSVFSKKLGRALVGEKLAGKYELEKLALLYESGKLVPFLKEQKEEIPLGGWLATMSPHFGTRVVVDHNMWPYFARRFGIGIAGFLEPKPGLSPTTKHLQVIIDMMKAQGVKVIISSPYFDPRHAQFAAKNTGAKIANLAHQAGSHAGTDDYLSMFDYNVRELAKALGGKS